jgi:hypothetical protein
MEMIILGFQISTLILIVLNSAHELLNLVLEMGLLLLGEPFLDCVNETGVIGELGFVLFEDRSSMLHSAVDEGNLFFIRFVNTVIKISRHSANFPR